MKEEKPKRKIRFTIRAKGLIIIFVFALVLIEIAMTYFSLMSSRNNQANYASMATNLANTTALVVDKQEFIALRDRIKAEIEDYITETGELPPMSEEWGSDKWIAYSERFRPIVQSEEFAKMHEYLADIADANSEDVDCVYIVYIDKEREFFVYVCDSAEYDPDGAFEDMDMCPPGCVDPIYDVNREVIDNPSRGFPTYTTNTEEYGWLATSGTAMYVGEHTNDNVVGFALVDVSLTRMRQKQANSIIELFFWLFGTVNLLAVIGWLIIYFIFTKPVKTINNVASAYDSDNPEKTHEEFQALNIKTHDEVQELAESLKRMENDSFERMNQLIETNRELRESRKETKEMRVLAKKDGLTSVQNKLAYNEVVKAMDKVIKEGKSEEFGVVMIDLNYLKETNDEYGHDAGDVALVKLAQLIRKTFKFSHIYRIGGDEFVVIIQKSDYAELEKLVDEFKDEILRISSDESLPAYERISAAIGYSKFDKASDKCVDDVFQRADAYMYENKRYMKSLK